jgi:hypothetical protein
MPSPQEMIDAIRRCDRGALLTLYDQIGSRRTPDFWADGMALEHLVLRAFELEGVEVQWPYRVPMPTSETTMEQIDGVLYIDGLAILVETKDTREPQNVEPVAKLRSQLDRRPPQVLGLVLSRTGFTAPAATLTRLISGGRIMLWTGVELRYALVNAQVVHGFRSKYRQMIEQAIPDLLIIPTSSLSVPEVISRGIANGNDVQS